MLIADLFDMAIAVRAPRCQGKDVPCDGCGELHYRKGSQLREPPAGGRFYCSRKCRHAIPARVDLVCSTCGRAYIRFKSQGRRGANNFCSKGCCAAFGRTSARCMWPGCSSDVVVRICVRKYHGKDVEVFNTAFKARGTRWGKSVFCPGHEEKLKHYLGRDGYRSSAGRLKILSDPDYEYDSRATSGTFLRAIIFDRASSSCEKCKSSMAWDAPAKTWEIDHILPVYRGGKTKISNLQMLCSGCHKEKTSAEKSEVAKIRWSGRGEKATRWMTHYEKDILITRLRERLVALGESG